MITIKQIEKRAKNCDVRAKSWYNADPDMAAKFAMQAVLFDCTAVICNCLLDISRAIENQR